MKPLEIISALPDWANASPGAILDAPAFAMPCRIGDESAVLRHASVVPAESDMITLSITFGDAPHALCIARSPRLPELGKIWDSRADVPEPVLLALAERECGPFFQMLENVVRRQLRLTGIGGDLDAPKVFLELSDGSLAFAVTRSDAIVAALGALRNLDLTHEDIRSLTLHAECEYAAFAPNDADFAALAPGDAVLLPEIGAVAPKFVVEGRFVVDAGGVAPLVEDALAHVRAAAGREIALGDVFDAADVPQALPAAEPGAQLKLVRGGRLVASGRLDRLSDQLAFIVEAT